MPGRNKKVNVSACEKRAMNLLERVANGLRTTGSQPILAFSGGKESVVCGHLVRRFGFRDAVRDSSYPFYRVESQIRDAASTLGLRVAHVDRFGPDWIWKNTQYLWPERAVQARYYRIAQHTTVARYAHGRHYRLVFFGRRRQTNCVPASVYSIASGMTHVLPLFDWTHEEVWSYIAKYDLPYNDIYDHDLGEKEGLTRWNMITPSMFNKHPMRLIADYDPVTCERLLIAQPYLRRYLGGKVP